MYIYLLNNKSGKKVKKVVLVLLALTLTIAGCEKEPDPVITNISLFQGYSGSKMDFGYVKNPVHQIGEKICLNSKVVFNTYIQPRKFEIEKIIVFAALMSEEAACGNALDNALLIERNLVDKTNYTFAIGASQPAGDENYLVSLFINKADQYPALTFRNLSPNTVDFTLKLTSGDETLYSESAVAPGKEHPSVFYIEHGTYTLRVFDHTTGELLEKEDVIVQENKLSTVYFMHDRSDGNYKVTTVNMYVI